MSHFFLEWEMFRRTVAQKIKPHILCSVTFFSSENRAFYDIMGKKYCRAAHATDDNMAHELCMQDT